MASNRFGKVFTVTTWGESHGKAIGAVIDGCPAGVEISEEDLYLELKKRQGGGLYTTARKEDDTAEILSGVFEGKTTGAPISIIIYNTDVKSASYEPIKDKIKPGHANYTYLAKYGIFDYRGGGRASARETACRVAAGAVAKKILKQQNIHIQAYIKELGGIEAEVTTKTLCYAQQSPIHCPDRDKEALMLKKLQETIERGDSLGAVIECMVENVPKGLGDPVYDKLTASLAHAMLSIPACRGVEFGSGFKASSMTGSLHNDLFYIRQDGEVDLESNNSGGIQGGISNGKPVVFRVAMKPTSSIQKSQKTLTLSLEETSIDLPPGSRHDPCVAIRAVSVVEAMAALSLVDAILMHKLSRI